MKYLAVRDWEDHQHYRGRTPPWIKLHNSLLDNVAFLRLSDTARAQLILIWLVASRHRNRIPNDARYLARAIQTTSKLQLKPLLQAGFLYETDEDSASEPLATRKQSASAVLATRKQDAIPEVEKEKEKEKETSTPRARAARSAPWMGRIREIHQARYQSEPPAALVKALRPLVEKHGPEEVAARYERYCNHTAGEHYNAWKIASTWADWGENAPARASPNGRHSAAEQMLTNVATALGRKPTGP